MLKLIETCDKLVPNEFLKYFAHIGGELKLHNPLVQGQSYFDEWILPNVPGTGHEVLGLPVSIRPVPGT